MNAQTQNNENPIKPSGFWSVTVTKTLTYLVLALSLGLIAFISYDTYQGVDYLENRWYMAYQLAACVIFLIDFFYRGAVSPHKLRFFLLAWPFLFISIPYLNIIEAYGLSVGHETLKILCFIPIVRGLSALVMVVTYMAKNISTTVFISYIMVLVPVIYMSGLIFYVAEKDINTAVKGFWYAQWWAGMTVTTIGCYINPMTPTGMILGFVLSLLGIIMLPLFTVYLGDMLTRMFKPEKSHKNG